MSTTLWGSVAANASTISTSGGYSVASTSAGIYVITFTTAFRQAPAIVATQNNFGNTNEENTDGVAVPLVSTTSATVITGDASGNKHNRGFGFIAIGNT
jgi:hypothetical protein